MRLQSSPAPAELPRPQAPARTEAVPHAIPERDIPAFSAVPAELKPGQIDIVMNHRTGKREILPSAQTCFPLFGPEAEELPPPPPQPTRTYYVNGIMTGKDEAVAAAELLGEELGREVTLNYNPTEGFGKDVKEAMKNLKQM